MSFSIPRQKISEMVLYIWKIINFPEIPYENLLFKISFDLFLYPPDEAKIFIENAIKNKFLIQDDDKNLKLSENLNSKLQAWQRNRKNEILRKMEFYQKESELRNTLELKNKDEFNILLKSFTDKTTLNRAVSVSESAFNIKKVDLNEGLILGNVVGSKEEPYLFKIDLNEKELKHNCHDFQTRRAKEKKFCKHLIRLFLILREKDQKIAVSFLRKISDNIEKWEFSD
ncbi:MAG: hypothetical protein ACFE8M_09105 [Candidatus Hermodarchaeota archaeon]